MPAINFSQLALMQKQNKHIPFVITISFLFSFLFIRLMVFIAGSSESQFAKVARMGSTPDVQFYIGRNIILFGYHIHHFYFGMLLICAAGWLALVDSPLVSRRVKAGLYGAGLGLFMDEIGLLLTWGDYYSGLTYLVNVFIAAIFLNVIFFPNFWAEVRKNLLQRKDDSTLQGSLSRSPILIRIADTFSQKIGKTESVSLLFAGIIYLGVGVFVLLYPAFLRYWVSSVFFIFGFTHMVNGFTGGPMKLYEKAGFLFTGLIYISVGILILLYPALLYYWVASVFLIHGILSLFRSWRNYSNR